MTFPGADTMNGGIMGEDCLRSIAGLVAGTVACGLCEGSCTDIESMGVRFIVAAVARQRSRDYSVRCGKVTWCVLAFSS